MNQQRFTFEVSGLDFDDAIDHLYDALPEDLREGIAAQMQDHQEQEDVMREGLQVEVDGVTLTVRPLPLEEQA